MKETETGQLMELLSKSNDIQSYLKENSDSFIDCTLADALSTLLADKGAAKPAVIKRSEINEIYCYQIFAGKRKPSRNTLLCLCVGLTLSVAETQRLLKIAGLAPLYPKSKRDSVILFGIGNKQSVCDINESLYRLDEPTL